MRRQVLPLLLSVAACGTPRPAAPLGVPTTPPQQPASAAPAPAPAAPVVDTDFLRAYVESQGFSRGAPQSPRLTPDGRTVLFLRSQPRDKKQTLFEMDVATGTVRETLTPEALDKEPEHLTLEERARRERMRVTSNGLTAFELSKDGKTVVVSLSGKLYALDRASGKTHPVDVGKGAAIDPRLSPDGKWIAFVQDDDVHVAPVDGSGKPTAVTRGGSADRTHGLAEFAAAEELLRDRGYWWSPDSKSILYEDADVSRLDHLTIADPAHPQNPPDRVAYPLTGHENARLRFGVTRLGSNGATVWLAWDHEALPYVANVSWRDRAPPTVLALDRLQKNASVLVADPKTGKTREAMHEHDDAWVNVMGFVIDPRVPRWLPDGSAFVWWSERGGDGRFGLVPASGAPEVKWLTPRGLQATELLDVDLDRRALVVETTHDGLHFEVDRVSLDGGDPKPIAKRDDGSLHAEFGEDAHDVFLAYESSLSDVHRVFVRSIDGKIDREIPSLAIAPRLPHPELTTAGPEGMHVAIVRPRSYVEGARYPLIDQGTRADAADCARHGGRQRVLPELAQARGRAGEGGSKLHVPAVHRADAPVRDAGGAGDRVDAGGGGAALGAREVTLRRSASASPGERVLGAT